MPDWGDQVKDAADTLGELIAESHHPDDRDRAIEVLTLLAGLWLDTEGIDQVYLGGEEP